jgi:hypothetical protein
VTFLEWFRNGGVFMYFVLYVDVIAIAVIIVLLMLKTQGRYKQFSILIVGLGLLPLLIGVFGNWVGYLEIMSALPLANPAEKQELYKEMMAIARIPSIFGGVSSAVLLPIGLLGLKFR